MKRCSKKSVVSGAIIVFLLGMLSILGSDGNNGTSDSGGDTNKGWLTLTYPTEEDSYPIDTSPQYLSGGAFISPTWYRCDGL